jgi:outer membrane cobalamin receptor
VGNPNLKAEKSENSGAGLEQILFLGGRWKFGLTCERAFVKDLIYWARRFDGKYAPYNLSAAKIETLRWDIHYEPLESVALSLNYALADPRERSWETNTHDQLLVFYPRKMLDLNLKFTPGVFYVDLRWRWISERFVTRANTIALESCTVTDLSSGLNLKIGHLAIDLNGRIDNLFSERYEIIEHYPMPPRSYSLQIGISYNPRGGNPYGF